MAIKLPYLEYYEKAFKEYLISNTILLVKYFLFCQSNFLSFSHKF